jgi:hypothetical protein
VTRTQTIQIASAGIIAPATLVLRLEWVRLACDLADALGDPVRRYWAHTQGLVTAIEDADGSALEAHYEVLAQEASRAPHAAIRWNFAFQQVTRALVLGELDEAERLAERALALGNETAQPDPLSIYAGELTSIRFHQGRLAELIPLLEQVVTEMPGLPVYRAVLAQAHAHGGDDDRAAAMLRDDRGRAFAMHDDSAWSTAIGSWADVAVRVRDEDAGHLLRDALVGCRDQMITTGITISQALSYCIGRLEHLLGNHDEAERRLAASMALHERLRSRMFVAYSQAATAELLAERDRGDDRERALDLATTALATASARGYRTIAADARAVLERLG